MIEEKIKVRQAAPRSLSPLATALVVAGPALLLSIGFTFFVFDAAQRQEREMFDALARRTQSIIMQRMAARINLLYAARAFMESAPGTVSLAEWRSFVAALDMERLPGGQGLGYTARIRPGEEAAHLARMRREGLEGYRLWPEGHRPDRTAITYLEPMDSRNRAAMGFDMYSAPIRREAMARARDMDAPALSGKVVLVQEITPQKQAGFLIYLPLYRKDAPVSTAAERRQSLLGYVYAPFRADDLFQGVFGDRRHTEVDFEIYDGLPSAESLLHDHNPEIHGLAPPRGTPQLSLPTTIAGRTWTIIFTATPEFEGEAPELLALGVFLSGLLVSLLLGGIAWSLASSRARAIALAADMTAELRQADRAKDEFLSVISHELRTPLNFITGFGSILEDEIAGPLNPQQREYLGKMLVGADRMLVLVSDLLDFAKIQAGKLDLLTTPTAFAPLVEEVRATMAPLAAEKGLSLTVDVPPDILVNGDGARIIQVLTNLVSNALKFTPAGGSIRMAGRVEGDHLLTEVSDTGIGIAPEDQPKLFTRFKQLDMSTTREVGGTGLGLSISKAIVEAHGGSIGLRSEKGQGSTFWFRLPLAGAPEDERASKPPKA